MNEEKFGPSPDQTEPKVGDQLAESAKDKPLTAEELLLFVDDPEALAGQTEQILAELEAYGPRFGLTARGLLVKLNSEITATPLAEGQLPPTLAEKLKKLQADLINDDVARD